MGWPQNLVFVRHAQSVGNVLTPDERARFDQSSHEYQLTDLGREQAFITGAWLAKHYGKFDRYYTSYYKRATETMHLIHAQLDGAGGSIYTDARLAEAQRGIYHTMTAEQIQDRFPFELIRKEREDLYHYRPFGGENWMDVELRIHSFLGTLARDYEGENVLVVCHGHWLMLCLRLIQHFSIEEAIRRYKEGKVFENASVTAFRARRPKGPEGPDRLYITAEYHDGKLVEFENLVPWK